MVSSATVNDQLVGKRNASRTPLRRPSKSSTLMSPTGKFCAQDRPQWRSMIHTGARTSETHRIAEAQKKRASRKARLYSTSSTSAGPTYPCPSVEERYRPELDSLATSAPTGSTKHTSSSLKKLWSSSETIDEQHLQRKQPEDVRYIDVDNMIKSAWNSWRNV